jgi:hypothetical protein
MTVMVELLTFVAVLAGIVIVVLTALVVAGAYVFAQEADGDD